MQQGETLAAELKVSQEKALSEASELHVKELEVQQDQIDKLKQEISSSKDKSQELEKLVSELQPYKEQAQVRTDTQRCPLSESPWDIEQCFDTLVTLLMFSGHRLFLL